jgi:hypothetical protein
LRGWWRTWPTANIGVATGARSGLFVLDVDPDKGGDATLGMLLSEHGMLPPTVEAITGSGGHHYLFAHPGRHTPNSSQKLGPGLDVRGDGGYIVVAPSSHRSGNTYEWQPGSAPWERQTVAAPAWIFDLLSPPVPSPQRQLPVDIAARRASAYLEKIPGAVAGQRGHDTAWKAALAVVRGFRLSEGEAFSMLASEYNPRCEPPWSEKELLHKVRSAMQDATVPFGYLLDAQRDAPPPAVREPGSDDDSPAPAIKPTRLNMQPISVLLAEEIPETEWLFLPYLETHSIAALVAPPSIGKTLLAFFIAAQVAASGKRVAIIEEEGGKRGFQKRIDRAMRATGKQENIFYSFKPRIHLMNKSDILALCVELAGYDLIVIDSLARVTTGVEENDAKEMGQIVESMDIVRERSGATVLSIHHTGKSKWKPGEVPALSDGRGSSALVAGLDTVLALAPVLKQTPGMVSFELHITKQRDEDTQVPPRLVTIAMTGPVAEVTMEETERNSQPSPSEIRLAQLIPLVLAEIPEPPAAAVSREEIQNELGRRPSDIRAAVNALIDQRKVKELSRKRLIRIPSNRPERTT